MPEDEGPLYLEVFREVAKSVEALPKESVLHITEVLKVLRDHHDKPSTEQK